MARTRLGQVRANVSDLRRSLDWYTNVLGFEVDFTYPEGEPNYAQFRTDSGAEFSIGQGGVCGGRFNFTVDSADEFWAEISAKGEPDVVEPLFTAPWGTRKFTIRDPDGNELGFIVPAR
jgi:catechol 2,3-dioxygenase-like lactoylglutathione lyase family enzyme